MTLRQAIEPMAFVAGVGIVTWQFRWLLGAYRSERDRQIPEHRSSRPFLLALGLAVFVALATYTNLYLARRIAVGGILLISVVEAVRGRFGKPRGKRPRRSSR